MLTPVGPGLSDDQRGLRRPGVPPRRGQPGAPLPAAGDPARGAPATGSSDIPAEQALDGAMPFRRFVGALVGNRLREIVRCDLALRGGDDRRAGPADARRRPRCAPSCPGCRRGWTRPGPRTSPTTSTGWSPRRRGPRPPSPAGPWPASPRCAASATCPCSSGWSAPPGRPGWSSTVPSRPWRCWPAARDRDPAPAGGRRPAAGRRDRRGVGPGAAGGRPPARRWPGSRRPCSRTPPRPRLALLRKTAPLLAAVQLGLPPTVPDVAAMTPAEAFAAGRDHERARLGHRRARQEFVDRWAKTVRKLGA